MAEGDLLKRQREILRNFRRISHNRSEAEANAHNLLESSKKYANALLTNVQRNVETQIKAHEGKTNELSQINKAHKLLNLAIFIYLLALIQWPYYLFISQIISAAALGYADSVWNMGEAVPGKEGRWDYLWLLLLPFVPLLVALYYLLSSYPKGLKAIHGRYPNALEQEKAHRQLREAEQENNRLLEQAEAIYQRDMVENSSTYEIALPKVMQANNAIALESSLMGAPWTDPLWKSWTPVNGDKVGSFVRIGSIVERGQWNSLSMPTLFSVIGGRNVVIKASGEAKGVGIQAVRSIMLRLLASVPPGKLRFILIDPVGHGQNLAAFLHLTDYDEALVGNKIWTESQHIEEQLARLTEHMEFIIQKFLRDKYKTIEDYNAYAEEIAEPYRVLVVLNFPVNFTDSSASRLVSIALNGPRCGIYAIITVDTEHFRQDKDQEFHPIEHSANEFDDDDDDD